MFAGEEHDPDDLIDSKIPFADLAYAMQRLGNEFNNPDSHVLRKDLFMCTSAVEVNSITDSKAELKRIMEKVKLLKACQISETVVIVPVLSQEYLLFLFPHTNQVLKVCCGLDAHLCSKFDQELLVGCGGPWTYATIGTDLNFKPAHLCILSLLVGLKANGGVDHRAVALIATDMHLFKYQHYFKMLLASFQVRDMPLEMLLHPNGPTLYLIQCILHSDRFEQRDEYF